MEFYKVASTLVKEKRREPPLCIRLLLSSRVGEGPQRSRQHDAN